MSLNWINVEEFSFNSLLLMERFQLHYLCEHYRNHAEWKRTMGIALRGNPAVKWYLIRKCPEQAALVEAIACESPDAEDAAELRRAEIYVLAAIEDFVTYTQPETMDQSCDFIYAWSKERLFEMADFQDKVVLDVGSGSGRLAFAAAERAKQVFASEPVDMLREYMCDQIVRRGIPNMRVVDGMAHCLPYPDDTFDIVVSGHVVGDDYEGEIAELTRVVKSGGWILDCPGEEVRKCLPSDELRKRGWEEFHYTSVLGGDVYRYRKQIWK